MNNSAPGTPPPHNAPKGFLVFLLAGLLLVLLSVLAFLWMNPPSQTQTDALSEAVPMESLGGPFRLTTHDGKNFTEADLKGYYHLMGFGFTHCPDICPGLLQTMVLALEALPQDMQQKIRPLFVTIDPARDTPSVMADYVKNFSPHLVGLSGTADEISTIAAAYKVYSRRMEEDVARAELREAGQAADDAAVDNYLVAHTSLIFVLNDAGQVVRLFSHNAEPEKIAAFLKGQIR
ncbi:MAG: SCO family protein [Alphaproteobacteria bacterium]|nr:SCO family protein [Alphaproteobacteria bacterium]